MTTGSVSPNSLTSTTFTPFTPKYDVNDSTAPRTEESTTSCVVKSPPKPNRDLGGKQAARREVSQKTDAFRAVLSGAASTACNMIAVGSAQTTAAASNQRLLENAQAQFNASSDQFQLKLQAVARTLVGNVASSGNFTAPQFKAVSLRGLLPASQSPKPPVLPQPNDVPKKGPEVRNLSAAEIHEEIIRRRPPLHKVDKIMMKTGMHLVHGAAVVSEVIGVVAALSIQPIVEPGLRLCMSAIQSTKKLLDHSGVTDVARTALKDVRDFQQREAQWMARALGVEPTVTTRYMSDYNTVLRDVATLGILSKVPFKAIFKKAFSKPVPKPCPLLPEAAYVIPSTAKNRYDVRYTSYAGTQEEAWTSAIRDLLPNRQFADPHFTYLKKGDDSSIVRMSMGGKTFKIRSSSCEEDIFNALVGTSELRRLGLKSVHFPEPYILGETSKGGFLVSEYMFGNTVQELRSLTGMLDNVSLRAEALNRLANASAASARAFSEVHSISPLQIPSRFDIRHAAARPRDYMVELQDSVAWNFPIGSDARKLLQVPQRGLNDLAKAFKSNPGSMVKSFPDPHHGQFVYGPKGLSYIDVESALKFEFPSYHPALMEAEFFNGLKEGLSLSEIQMLQRTFRQSYRAPGISTEAAQRSFRVQENYLAADILVSDFYSQSSGLNPKDIKVILDKIRVDLSS